MPAQHWRDIDPKDAVDLDLATNLDVTAPLNERGQRCPCPWEPQQLINAPIGQYRCSYCSAMVMAGEPHFDYRPVERQVTPENLDELHEWCPASKVHRSAISAGDEALGLKVLTDDGPAVALISDWITRDGFGSFTIRKDDAPC
ncbi:hypothetical protein ABZ502_17870 [Streptomyces abikoensis]|uniref:hypothetical protein n=1 Tax=Streptomyces abikoensis TaxID=97398 RepID=UPI0033D249CE